MYIDVKYTIWQRAKFSDEANINIVIEKLKAEHEFDKYNVPDVIHDDTYGFIENEILYDTDEFMSPQENNAATIEVYNDKHECVWTNFDE